MNDSAGRGSRFSALSLLHFFLPVQVQRNRDLRRNASLHWTTVRLLTTGRMTASHSKQLWIRPPHREPLCAFPQAHSTSHGVLERSLRS